MGKWSALAEGLSGMGEALVKNPEVAGKVIKGAGKGLVYAGVGGYAGWHILVKGEGLDELAVGAALGDEAKSKYKDEGLVGGLKLKVFGNKGAEKSIAGNAVDQVVGDGTYKKMGDAGRATVDAAQGAYHTAVGTAQEVYHEARGMMSSQQMQQNGYAQQADYSQYTNMSGMYNPFTSVNNMVGNITGGRMSAMNLAGILAAAYMMFGSRFGWMGKVAGVMLGGMTAKDMQSRQVQANIAHQTPYYPTGYVVSNQQPQQQQESEEENNHTVSRIRI